MRRQFLLLIVLLCIATACAPVPSIAQPAAPSNSAIPSTAATTGLPYQADLIPASQDDLALLDHPTLYGLTLKYDPAQARLVGTETVQYYNHQTIPLPEIYFRLLANYPGTSGKIAVTNISVNDAPASGTLQAQNTALRVPMSPPLAPNTTVNLRLEFTVTVPRDEKGRYAEFTAAPSVVTMPSVYPFIPGYDAQGWHIEVPPPYGDAVYADASIYTVSMTVPSTFTVIASGSTVGTLNNGDGTTTWRLVGAPIRDFDLNLTNQLKKVSGTVGETTINSYYEPSDEQSGKQALKIALASFEDYETMFGPYPYRELDVVETMTTGGGYEYPGVVVFGREFYQDPGQHDFFEFALAHEVAHQWWYGLVGDDQVNTPWVDEALAMYSTVMYEETQYGQAAADKSMQMFIKSPYEQAKASGHDAPVNQPVTAFSDADYGSIVYGKGPLFYDAIRKKMGNPVFLKFLQTYYQKYRYQIAWPEDILQTAESVCSYSLQTEWQQWITGP